MAPAMKLPDCPVCRCASCHQFVTTASLTADPVPYFRRHLVSLLGAPVTRHRWKLCRRRRWSPPGHAGVGRRSPPLQGFRLFPAGCGHSDSAWTNSRTSHTRAANSCIIGGPPAVDVAIHQPGRRCGGKSSTASCRPPRATSL